MSTLCTRCQSTFSVKRNEVNNSWEHSRPKGLWGSYADLHEAAVDGCVVCQDSWHAFKQQGINLMPLDNPTSEVHYEFLSNCVVFRARLAKIFREGCIWKAEGQRQLYLSTSYDNPLHSLFSEIPLSGDSSSEACFALAKGWLKSCLRTHKACPKRQVLLPRRTIDVGTTIEDPFLYISRPNEFGHWVTLSHCWGAYHTITTTASSLAAHCKSLKLDALPETFRDAVLITRQLGYRYLWIDSLCIIQDSEEDWRLESEKMASIFENAVLNISADASGGDDQGIFRSAGKGRPKPDHLVIPYTIPAKHLDKRRAATILWQRLQQGELNIIEKGRIIGQLFATPVAPGQLLKSHEHVLQQRGWVLQESVLSQRKLRYVQGGLHWSCAEGEANEKEPIMRRKVIAYGSSESLHGVPFINYRHKTTKEDPEGNRVKQLAWWYEHINRFVRRKLTFPRDRIPAILGLANAYCERSGYTFRCGILVEDFRRGLLWQGPTDATQLEHFPSWSWASVAEKDGDSKAFNFEGYQVQGWYFNAELVGIPLSSDYEKDTGTLGFLTLRGYTRPMNSFCPDAQFHESKIGRSIYHPHAYHAVVPEKQPDSEPASYIQLGVITCGDDEWSPRAAEPSHELWLDTPITPSEAQAFLKKREAIAFRVGNFKAAEWQLWQTYYLVLDPVEPSSDTFRRLGLLRITNPRDWTDREGSTIDESAYEVRTVKII
ncbi:HET-domain-containing protein [Acephala macrosclerotiorum]|nr:HET-domain-containing protein [Acephala macrosclerotiorum]